MAAERAFTAGHFMLMLDGDEPAPEEDRRRTPRPTSSPSRSAWTTYIHKHITQPEYDDISSRSVSRCRGLPPGSRTRGTSSTPARTAPIVALDSHHKARSVRDFYEALITEVGIPALDASGKDPCYLSLKFADNGDGPPRRPTQRRGQRQAEDAGCLELQDPARRHGLHGHLEVRCLHGQAERGEGRDRRDPRRAQGAAQAGVPRPQVDDGSPQGRPVVQVGRRVHHQGQQRPGGASSDHRRVEPARHGDPLGSITFKAWA